MTIRLRYKLTVGISTSIAEDKDLGNQEAEALIDTLNDGGTLQATLAASAVDQLFQHPQVASAKMLYLRATSKDPTLPPAEITVKRNSAGGEPWPVTPVDGKAGHLLISTSGLTAVYLSNPGAVDMVVVLGVAGD